MENAESYSPRGIYEVRSPNREQNVEIRRGCTRNMAAGERIHEGVMRLLGHIKRMAEEN